MIMKDDGWVGSPNFLLVDVQNVHGFWLLGKAYMKHGNMVTVS